VASFLHEDLLFARAELLAHPGEEALAQQVADDVRAVSPSTRVTVHELPIDNPWDFERVWDALYGWAREASLDPEREDVLTHITTGSHVEQIVLFLLTESRHLPGRLLQSSPPRRRSGEAEGTYRIIDLDLSRYDRIAARFRAEEADALTFLKAGIATRNARFNAMMRRIEQVATATRAPILLTGPTGAGKTRLARRIYELKRTRRHVSGAFVEVNCATLRGDQAMAALFGHTRGAFTGATRERPGLLRAADGGLLFLDEVGELGLDEQAMLLRALEEGRFLPVGADREVSSDFQLLAGTNRDLGAAVAQGRFREDLLARVDLWTFHLPGLTERPEDIEPNLDYELDAYARANGRRVGMSHEARRAFLAFATSPGASWRGNFRDLNAAVQRMATLAVGGRITEADVAEEIARLERSWANRGGRRAGGFGVGSEASAVAGATPVAPQAAHARGEGGGLAALERLLGAEGLVALDRFDRVQLADVVSVVRRSRSLAEAGRTLFAASRARKASRNDSDRLRKYLAKFGLRFADIAALDSGPEA